LLNYFRLPIQIFQLFLGGGQRLIENVVVQGLPSNTFNNRSVALWSQQIC
jgi:hypothetical protein